MSRPQFEIVIDSLYYITSLQRWQHNRVKLLTERLISRGYTVIKHTERMDRMLVCSFYPPKPRLSQEWLDAIDI